MYNNSRMMDIICAWAAQFTRECWSGLVTKQSISIIIGAKKIADSLAAD